MPVKVLMRLSQGMTFVAACICFPIILIIMLIDVFNRYVLNSPWAWSGEACSLLLFTAIALTLPESWRLGYHIRADFIRANMPAWAQIAVERLVWVLVIILSVAIIRQSWIDGKLMIMISERSNDLDVPLVWFRVLLAFSAVVMGLIGLWGLVTGTVADPGESFSGELE